MNSKSSEEVVGGVDDVTTSFHDVPPVVAAAGVLRGRGISPMEGTSMASNSLMAVLRCSGGWNGALGSSCQEELYDVYTESIRQKCTTHTTVPFQWFMKGAPNSITKMHTIATTTKWAVYLCFLVYIYRLTTSPKVVEQTSNVWTRLDVASAHTLDAVYLVFVCVHLRSS